MKAVIPIGLASCALVSLVYFIRPDFHTKAQTATIARESYSATFAGYITKTAEDERKPFVTNNSDKVVYYKPESFKLNPGFNQNGIYTIQPGEKLYFPVDGVVTTATLPGHVYKVPTGGSIVIGKDGIPSASNVVGVLGNIFSFGHYGDVVPPDPNFQRLALVGSVVHLQ